MDKDTFLGKITEIGSCENIVEVRTKLTELSNEVTSVFDNNATLTEQNQNYESKIGELQSANMQLFLEIGKNKKPEQDPTTTESTAEPLKYENLFNEQGELK